MLIKNYRTGRFLTVFGVIQGCVCALFLFLCLYSVYINDLIAEIRPAGTEVRLSNFTVGTFPPAVVLTGAEQAADLLSSKFGSQYIFGNKLLYC